MNRKPKIWITVLLAAFLMGLLSLVLPKNEEKYLSEHFWTRKTLSTQKYNVVVMGDSRVYRGVSPDVMKEYLPGLKVLNFGYSNGGLNPTMFRAAEAKITKSDKEKVIIMGISANTVTGFTENNNQYLQELTRPREEVIERLYFSPVKYWFSPTSPEGLKQHFWGVKENTYYYNHYHLNGYVLSEKFPVDTMEAIPSYIKDFTNYKVDQRKLSDLYQQVSEWTQHGILVFGFRPPVSHPMYLLEDTLGLYNETAIKTSFTAAGGYWIDLQHTDYQTYDGSHLEERSAIKLSKKLAESIHIVLEE
jgi:hypothetical protein